MKTINPKNSKTISDLIENESINSDDLFVKSDTNQNIVKKIKFSNIINTILYYAISALNTTVKTLVEALNELKTNLTDGSATKVGTSTVGNNTIPIYLNSGVPTASSSTVGNDTKPVYLSNGFVTALTETTSYSSSDCSTYLLSGEFVFGRYIIPDFYFSETWAMIIGFVDIGDYSSLSGECSVTLNNSSWVPTGQIRCYSSEGDIVLTQAHITETNYEDNTISYSIYVYKLPTATSTTVVLTLSIPYIYIPL